MPGQCFLVQLQLMAKPFHQRPALGKTLAPPVSEGPLRLAYGSVHIFLIGGVAVPHGVTGNRVFGLKRATMALQPEAVDVEFAGEGVVHKTS